MARGSPGPFCRIARRTRLAFAHASVALALSAGAAPTASASGYVAGFGIDASGQLGNGGPNDPFNATLEWADVSSGLHRAIAIAAGHQHTIAIGKDGTVWAWGAAAGAGNGTAADLLLPQQKLDLGGAYVDVAGGGWPGPNKGFSLALRSDGAVFAWGSGADGQLGDGVSHAGVEIAARQALLPAGVTQVSAGGSHALALVGGVVFGWGSNYVREAVGGASTAHKIQTPIQVPGLTDVVRVDAAWSASFAVRNDGTLWGWGIPSFAGPVETAPVQIPVPCDVVDVDGNFLSALALCSDGSVWFWGALASLDRQLNGWFDVPTQVAGLSNVVRIATGAIHFLALDATGDVWAWGDNAFGELGDGTQGCVSSRATPVRVISSGIWGPAAVDIAAGYGSSAVLVQPDPVSTFSPLALELSIQKLLGPFDAIAPMPIQGVGVSPPFTAQLVGIESEDPAVLDGTVYPPGTPCLASCGVQLALPPAAGVPPGPTSGTLTLHYVDGSQQQLDVTGEMRVLSTGPACGNGLDDDGDGRVDLDDPGCTSGNPAVPDPTRTTESPSCSDGFDNDRDSNRLVDFDGGQSVWGACSNGTCPPLVSDPNRDGIADPDPHCVGKPWRDSEKAPAACGLGVELAALLPLLALLRRRRVAVMLARMPSLTRLAAGTVALGLALLARRTR